MRYSDLPECCRKCAHLGEDWNEISEVSCYGCLKGLFFPFKKLTCKKQAPKGGETMNKKECDCLSREPIYLSRSNLWKCSKCGKKFFEHDGGLCEALKGGK